MDVAVVTAAASGVGLAVARKLVEIGHRVYGLGGNYSNMPYSHDYFVPMPCDLTDVRDIEEKTNTILQREGNIFIVVNNAKVFSPKPFGEMEPEVIEATLQVNLLCPLILTRLALPSLKRLHGFVINIGATTAATARGGPVSAASAGGLHWMSQACFEELREDGVKVTTLFPQTNRYRPDDAGSPLPGRDVQSVINPDVVAEAVERIVSLRDGNVITEMVLRPLKEREEVVPAVYDVPTPKPRPQSQASKESTITDLAQSGQAIRKKIKKVQDWEPVFASAHRFFIMSNRSLYHLPQLASFRPTQRHPMASSCPVFSPAFFPNR